MPLSLLLVPLCFWVRVPIPFNSINKKGARVSCGHWVAACFVPLCLGKASDSFFPHGNSLGIWALTGARRRNASFGQFCVWDAMFHDLFGPFGESERSH